MVKVRLDDEFLIENCKVIIELKSLGLQMNRYRNYTISRWSVIKKAGEQHD